MRVSITVPDSLLCRAFDIGSKLLEVSATPGWLRPVQYLDPSTAPVPSFTIAEAADGVKSRLSGDEKSLIGSGAQQFCLDMAPGTWTHTRQVDFGAGDHTSISLRVMARDSTVITLHLDSPTATPAVTCAVEVGTEWGTVSCALPAHHPLQGVHDLWIMVDKPAASHEDLSPVPAPTVGPGCQVSSQDSICYADNTSTRTLNGANPGGHAPVVGAPRPLTNEFCAWQCYLLNFSLAGTEYGHECYCANELSGRPHVLAQSGCDMPCSGKRTKASSLETCGGFKTVSVFPVNCSSAVPPPYFPNGTAGPPPPPPPPSPIVAFAWWQLQGGTEFISRAPSKADVPVNISASTATGSLPVGVLGNKLVAGHDAEHAMIALEDNEDGTYALKVDTASGLAYACSVAGSMHNGAELLLTAKVPTEACARFRVQVIKDPPGAIASGNHFALRSAAVGLWVSACGTTLTQGACSLSVTTLNPLEDVRAAFTISTLRGDQAVPPH